MKFAFVFVCQAGELEIQSMLLAASLRQQFGYTPECIAAIPQPESRWGTLSPDTLSLIQTLKLRKVLITNPVDQNYGIANKIGCLDVETNADLLIFLDSDILCLQYFSPETHFKAQFHAKPADLATFTKDTALWQKIYGLFQLPLPTWRVVSTVSNEVMLPYFNSGVTATKRGLNFAQTWAQCCQTIDADKTIPNKRPWLDQAALPLTVTKLNLTHQCLDERFNFPLHLKPLPLELPFLCHYHWPTILRREPRLNKLVTDLIFRYPSLTKLLKRLPTWEILLKPHVLHKFPRRLFQKPVQKSCVQAFNAKPELLITGMPRSGTSYLCRLLHSLQDCVIINEPTEIFPILIEDKIPWRLAVYHEGLRQTILEGFAIENKVSSGKVVEDTNIEDARQLYVPKVSHADFLLGTKNTLAYLARLRQLRQVMPNARIIACIRHPLDTIASWKTSFPHLQQADVNNFPLGHPDDPFLEQWQREQLQEIANTDFLPLKRALLWRYLAECLLYFQSQLTLVHYETLVQQPLKTLKSILATVPTPHLYPTEKIVASTVKHKREVLEENDKQAIQDVCAQAAKLLGYHL